MLQVCGRRSKSGTVRCILVASTWSTLDDRDRVKKLTLLSQEDVDALEDTLQKFERMQARQVKVTMGPTKFGQELRTRPTR